MKILKKNNITLGVFNSQGTQKTGTGADMCSTKIIVRQKVRGVARMSFKLPTSCKLHFTGFLYKFFVLWLAS